MQHGYELEQTLGNGEGQGSLPCCSPWGREELDMTWRLNKNHHQCNQVQPMHYKVRELE